MQPILNDYLPHGHRLWSHVRYSLLLAGREIPLNNNNEPTSSLYQGAFLIAHRHRFNGMVITGKDQTHC